MKVLVTGARGFVGSNLCASLKSIRDGKDRRDRYVTLKPLTVYEYDIDGTDEELSFYASEADFVFNLAGVNRPKHNSEFMQGNFGFVEKLLDFLELHRNTCPVMMSSSAQASLVGRFEGSEYGKSKLAGERLLRDYSTRTGAKALIYRFPNLYGKWCRPNYNSAVATFCNNIANNLPVQIDDPAVELELLYIDDLVTEMLETLLGEEHRCDYEGITPVPNPYGEFCYVPNTSFVELGQIVSLLQSFKEDRATISIQSQAEDSFSKKLYSAYISYLNPMDFAYKLKKNEDARGSFTEFLRTPDRGQISVNVSKPGVIKGQHWHHSKWEKFLVVSGEALIQLRRIGLDKDGKEYPIIEYRVNGDDPAVVEMVPGYAHNIINLSNESDLITVMWANEAFDSERPDTYYEEV